jgi:Class II Aldolase and Adducin N-terminal domain
MSDIFLVGGTFDDFGGTPSSIVKKLGFALECRGIHNGGNLSDLRQLDFTKMDTLVWMPHIDNAEDKILPSIKKANPKLLLVSSKRIVEKEYTLADVIGRLLQSHSNLGIVIERTKDSGTNYVFKLLDPLGNIWADTGDIARLAAALYSRIKRIQGFTRIRSRQVSPDPSPFSIEPEFITVIRELGTKFAGFVNAHNPNRLLGNAATRCSYGFPAVKEGERLFVTRRNVDKATLSEADFVEVAGYEDEVTYAGSNKPSVDSPIQLRLFRMYTNVKYIVHGHVYVQDAPTTDWKLPCGTVEEADEIKKMVPDLERSNFAVNLRGHGCLLLAHDLTWLRSRAALLVGRPFPEPM